MSLNFFKKESKKTDASLSYGEIINNLRSIDNSNFSINVDQFIQSENINLRQHQEFYESRDSKYELPKCLEKENKYTKEDTRGLANSLIDISERAASIRSEISTLQEKVNSSSIQNKETAQAISILNELL